MGLMLKIFPRYRDTCFQHIFAGGYASGSSSCMWSEVLDNEAFQAFTEWGLFELELARAFRTQILKRGWAN